MFLHLSVILFTGGVQPHLWQTPLPLDRQADPPPLGRPPPLADTLTPGSFFVKVLYIQIYNALI